MDYLEHVNIDVTEDIEKYIKQVVMEYGEFLVLDENGGYCTRCNNANIKTNANHNAYETCPMCGARVQVKYKRYGRKKLKNRYLIYSFEKSKIDKNTIVAKAYTVIREDYTDYKNVKNEYILEAVYIFDEKETCMYQTRWGTNRKMSIFDINNILGGPFNNSSWETWIDIKSFQKASRGTKYEYCELEEVLIEFRWKTADRMLKYLELYNKNQMVESLVKIGFKRLVAEKINGDTQWYACNWRGKTIYKILKLKKKTVKEVVKNKNDIGATELKVIQIVEKQNLKMSMEDIQDIAFKFNYRIFTLEKMMEYTKLDKLLRYFKKQINIEEGVYGNYVGVLSIFADYIDDLKKLNLDLKDKKIIFPKELMLEHNRLTALIKHKEDKLLSKKILDRKKELDKYKFIADGFILRPIRSYKELIKEGKVLGHCVGGYAHKHANKQTSIFVIREIENPAKPFYTVEMKKGRVVQVRGKGNRCMIEEVENFVEKFKITKLNKSKLEKKNEIIKIA